MEFFGQRVRNGMKRKGWGFALAQKSAKVYENNGKLKGVE